jgi:hypothetical protein
MTYWQEETKFISNLKYGSYRNAGYLAFLRKQKCFSCPTRGDDMVNPITASHIFRGDHGMKNHDWASVPMCGWCHWEYEYHKEVFGQHARMPTTEDAERYFQKYLEQSGKQDDRKPEQLKPI